MLWASLLLCFFLAAYARPVSALVSMSHNSSLIVC